LRGRSVDSKTDRFLFTRPIGGAVERYEIALSIGWGSRLAAELRARSQR